jgi:hypothetical protein
VTCTDLDGVVLDFTVVCRRCAKGRGFEPGEVRS